jgi:sugar (pentulose or hexulose) kinase
MMRSSSFGPVRRVPELVLAVDLGTTAIKVALYDRRGATVAQASREYALLTPRPDWVELSCRTYWETFVAAVHDLWRSDVERRSVCALALSAQGETLVPVDAAGMPLRNAIVWLDNRARHEAAELGARFGNVLYEVTGQPEMLGAWPAAKLLWLARHEPDVTAKTSRYLLIEDFFLLRLAGSCVTEASLATSTCYWDFRRKDWWPAMLDAVAVGREQLPEIVEPGSPVGRILGDAAEELGLADDVLICAGALDQACGAIGAGNVADGGFSENTGAAVALCATIDEPRLDPAHAMPCHYHGLPGRYMFHTFTSGGIVLRWFRDNFCEPLVAAAADDGGDVYERLSEVAAAAPAGADGLIMLPHLQGAMAPENNDTARGVLLGLTLSHGRGHVARAIMEAIAFIVRRNVEVLRGLGVGIDAVRALGGGSRSAVWKQIEADVLGIPVVTMREPDAGTLGAAILAGLGVGWWTHVGEAVADMVAEDRVFAPNANVRDLYEQRYHTYRDTYDALVPVFSGLAARKR